MYFPEELRIASGIVVVFVVIMASITAAGNYSAYVSGEAAITQLRRDVQRVGVAQSEDVIGQVTQANQNIVKWQRWNRVPVIQLWIPNGWDRIQTIEIPQSAP